MPQLIASSEEVSNIAELIIRVPGLVLLPDYPDYEKFGNKIPAQKHHTPPWYKDEHIHWCLDFLVAAIYYMADEYVDKGGERIIINDLSLPYGELFDINGDWQPPHKEHRGGNNADISGAGRGGRFLREDIMRRVIKNMEKKLDLIIEYSYEESKNHYHFYFFSVGTKRGEK